MTTTQQAHKLNKNLCPHCGEPGYLDMYACCREAELEIEAELEQEEKNAKLQARMGR